MIITVKKVQYRYVKDAYIKKLRYIITQFFVEFFPIYKLSSALLITSDNDDSLSNCDIPKVAVTLMF